MCGQRFESRSKCISTFSAAVMKHDQKHSEERVYLAFGFTCPSWQGGVEAHDKCESGNRKLKCVDL